MKLKYIAISLLALTLFASCNRDEESLFEKSAAQRAVEAIDNANAVLTAPENGWEMVYFPNTENTTTSRGYVLIVKFKMDGSVSVTAKNSLTTNNVIVTDSNSTWTLISDYGPLLSFDTYNSVLHAWSDPQTDGDGYLGDYEFLILKASADKVILKGKKHSAYSVLRPLKTVDIAAHYAACEQMQSSLFKNANIVSLQQGNKVYDLYNGTNGIFRLTNHGETYSAETASHYGFCATTDGIVLNYGFEDEKNERIFTYKDNQLVGENGSVINAGNLNYIFKTYIANGRGWTEDVKKAESPVSDKIEAFVEALKTISGDATKASVLSLGIGYSESANLYQGAYFVRVRFQYKNGSKTTTENADFEITIAQNESSVDIAYVQPMTTNAKNWSTAAPSLLEVVNTFVGTFTVQPNPDNVFNSAVGSILEGDGVRHYIQGATVK